MLDIMFLPQPRKDFLRRCPFAALHGLQTPLDTFDSFCTVNQLQEFLIRGSILHNDFSFAVNRKHFRTARFLEPLDMFFCVALKIGECATELWKLAP